MIITMGYSQYIYIYTKKSDGYNDYGLKSIDFYPFRYQVYKC